MENTVEVPPAKMIDIFGEVSIFERKYYIMRHGLRFVACGIESEGVFFLVRELLPHEAHDRKASVCIIDGLGKEAPLNGIIVATLANMSAADAMIQNFEENIWRLTLS